MFGWLFSKSESPASIEETPIVVEPPVEDLAGEVKTSMYIILKMEEYIEENMKLSTMPRDRMEELAQAYDKLNSIGLHNSKNARILKQRIDSINDYNNQIDNAHKVLQFIKDLRAHFGENVILIGSNQFRDLCNKYSLSVGTLDQYTGVIPDKNLQELLNAQSKLQTFKYYPFNGYGCLYQVYSVDARYGIADDAAEAVRNWFNTHSNLIGTSEEDPRCTRIESEKILEPDLQNLLGEYEFGDFVGFNGKLVSCKQMLMACPMNQLQHQTVELIREVVDPIVFQPCPYGIIIYTMWGEESEDEIIQEYKRLNNLINL